MNKNTKTFRMVNVTSKSFSIIIANFQFAATLIINLRSKIKLTFSPSLLIKMSSLINLRKVKILISKVSLITKIIQTINSRTIKIITVFKQRMKFITSIDLHNPILIVSKARQKILSTINNGKLSVITSPVFVILYTLGHWDVDTLLPLDSMTLGDMDYTIV